jgi:hypothetical protein
MQRTALTDDAVEADGSDVFFAADLLGTPREHCAVTPAFNMGPGSSRLPRGAEGQAVPAALETRSASAPLGPRPSAAAERDEAVSRWPCESMRRSRHASHVLRHVAGSSRSDDALVARARLARVPPHRPRPRRHCTLRCLRATHAH